MLILAKAPEPGRVKTRLCPPLTPVEAAALAEAALRDTLAAAVAAASHVVLVLDGEPAPWVPPGVEVVPQATGGLDRRLARAWAGVSAPAVQIGMDTPQLAPADLDHAYRVLLRPGVDAVLGPAADGGWWLIGLRRGRADAFLDVPASQPDTGARQLDRLRRLGLRVELLEVRRDVDTVADAAAVADEAPGTRFAAAFRDVVDTGREDVRPTPVPDVAVSGGSFDGPSGGSPGPYG